MTTKAQSDKNSSIFCIPWQAIEVLHICSSTPSPQQNVSKFTGLGLSHDSCPRFDPLSHVVLQAVQADKELLLHSCRWKRTPWESWPEIFGI